MKPTNLVKITVLMSALLIILGTTSTTWAATYYVSKSGNDSNNGTSTTTPFLTIQRGLNAVRAGDTVNIMAGTYNEALVLATTGTSSARITVQNYQGASVAVSSGTNRAISFDGRTIGYYTISGITFTSTHVTNYPGYVSGQFDYSLDFCSKNWWGYGKPYDSTPYSATDSNGCNGFVIKNCVINGSIAFMGHNNRVENCTLNGGDTFTNAIYCFTIVSHHNTYTGNKITRYTDRAIWAMSNCSYITVTYNDISHWGAAANPAAVDMDGAWLPVYYSLIQHNTIHDGDGSNSMGMQFENGMYCVCDSNTIYNVNHGLTGVNYTKNSAGGPFGYGYYNFQTPNDPLNLVAVPSTANGGIGTTPYVTSNVFSNNVVYNTYNTGIELFMTWGDKLYNNTFNGPSPWGAIFLSNQSTPTGVTGIAINNNIIANSKISIVMQSGGSFASLTNNLFYGNSSNPHLGTAYQTGNPLFINAANGDFSVAGSSPAIRAGATVAAVTSDILGKARPSGGYDIGAYQYGSGAALTPPVNLTVQ